MRVIALLLLLGSVSVGVVPDSVTVITEEPREGAQWVQADAQGRAVLLLDGVTLEERPFAEGAFRDPEPLTQAAMTHGVVRRAARSRDGSSWVFVAPPGLRYFRGSQEERLAQPDRHVLGIGFHDGQPVVSVSPFLTGRTRPPGFSPPEDLPLVLVYAGDEWETLLERRNLVDEDTEQAQLDSYLVFATDARRNLWAAHLYRYRVYQLSPSGKLRLTLEVDEGTPVPDEATDEEREAATEALREAAKAAGLSLEGATIIPTTQKPILDGIVAGLDGNIYLFASGVPGDFPALDRYNPYTNTLERLPLRIDYRGSVSMAAAKDGLLLAGYTVPKGIWMIPWERLESASWKPVEGATADGLPLLPPQSRTSPQHPSGPAPPH